MVLLWRLYYSPCCQLVLQTQCYSPLWESLAGPHQEAPSLTYPINWSGPLSYGAVLWTPTLPGAARGIQNSTFHIKLSNTSFVASFNVHVHTKTSGTGEVMRDSGINVKMWSCAWYHFGLQMTKGTFSWCCWQGKWIDDYVWHSLHSSDMYSFCDIMLSSVHSVTH